ncbi:MAG: hypothetical protein P8Z35_26795, partial [Ignavibacteriaceae bacterium]
MRKLTILIVLILFFSSVSFLYADIKNTITQDIDKITTDFFKLIKANQFESASELFHYPNNYSREDLVKEKIDVIETLKFLKNEFGAVTQLKISNSPGKVIGYGVSGASIEYWQKHAEFIFQIFNTNFERIGEGYIRISYCKINNKWEIQGVE